MRALQLVGWKQPPEFRDVPDPEPGPEAVVVRVAAGSHEPVLHATRGGSSTKKWPMGRTTLMGCGLEAEAR